MSEERKFEETSQEENTERDDVMTETAAEITEPAPSEGAEAPQPESTQTENTDSQEGQPDIAETEKKDSTEPKTDQPRYGYYHTHEEKDLPPYQNPQKPEKEQKKSSSGKKFGATVSLAVVFGLVAGLVFQGVNMVSDRFFSKDASNTQIAVTEPLTKETKTEEAAGEEADKKPETSVAASNTVADVAALGIPSVVAITSVSMQEIPSYFGRFFGYGGGIQEYPTAGSGSGIIVGENDDELLIATNQHVVSGATTISVCFMGSDVVSAEQETADLASGNGDLDLENAVTGKVKGESSEDDLAVVAVKKADIPEETRNQIRIASLDSSDDLVVGQQVVAIGNALGIGQSVTSGYVSALNRSLTTSDGKTSDSLIQTDAAINPGNSGGALLNMNGEVVGINSAKYASDTIEGMGYAIPISEAKPILDDLMNRETRDKVDENKSGYLGVMVINLTQDMIRLYDLPQGAFVDSVTEGEAAEKAGIKKGDVIAAVDGQEVSGKEGLVDILQYYEAGETVKVDIYRSDDGEYKKQTVEVTLGRRKDEQNSGNMENSQQQEEIPEEVPSIDDFFNSFG